MNRQIVNKIVKASGIQEGELVLLHFWGEQEHEDILEAFSEAVVAVGASPLQVRQSRSRNQKLFAKATESSFGEKYFSIFEKVDTVLDIFAYQPVVLGAQLEEEQMLLYKHYMGNLFGALAKVQRFLQIRIPTEENALESGLKPEEYITRMEQAYDIDYELLKEKCIQKKAELEQASGVIITTGNEYELQLSLRDRKWEIDAGEGDMPCGEIFIAPVEEETEGRVYFEKLYVEDMGVYEDVVFEIHNGILEKSNCAEVNEFLQQLGTAERTVCELGFGMNEHITDLCGYVVLDEKMCDTFHIAIGNNTMFGGKNQAQLHMDFVGKGNVNMVK